MEILSAIATSYIIFVLTKLDEKVDKQGMEIIDLKRRFPKRRTDPIDNSVD